MGINQAEIVVIFISDQYAKSKTCEQELVYAMKTCKKPTIPVVVGKGMEWEKTGCGFLLSTEVYLDFRDASKFNANIDMLISRLLKMLP